MARRKRRPRVILKIKLMTRMLNQIQRNQLMRSQQFHLQLKKNHLLKPKPQRNQQKSHLKKKLLPVMKNCLKLILKVCLHVIVMLKAFIFNISSIKTGK